MVTSSYTHVSPTMKPEQSLPSRPMLAPASAALIVATLTVIAAVLRLHLLAAKSLWIDEAASVNFTTMAWWPFLRLLWSYQGNMTLYYFLLRGWVHLGDSEAVVRGLSVLFGVVTVPAIYALGARMFDRVTGVTAAALLAVHSFHIQWSQEARAYSLLTFLLVLTTYFFVRAMDSPLTKRYWAAFTLSAALSVYAHIFAVFLLPAYALAIVLPRPFTVKLRTVAAATVSFAFLIFPISAFVLLQHSSQINWIPRPTLADIYQFLDLLTGHGGLWSVVAYLALCVLALAPVFGSARSERETWSLRLVALWLLLPPLLALAATPFKPLFFSRYMIMCVPALVLLASRGITRVAANSTASRAMGTACLVVVLSLSAWGTARYFGSTIPTEDWRSAVSYILQREHPGDGAVFYIPNDYGYLYYVRRAASSQHNTEAPVVLYPTEPRHAVSRDGVLGVTKGRPRVWLVLCNQSVNPQAAAILQSAVSEQFQKVESHVFVGEDPITVTLYSRPVTGR
jgi:mannosyltransferase